MSAVTYYPTDEEAIEGIGPWTLSTPEPQTLEQQYPGMAAFELDRIAAQNARYAKARQDGTDAVSLLNGSIGSTSIPVNRGAW